MYAQILVNGLVLSGGYALVASASPQLKDAYLGMASGPPHSYPGLDH